MKRLVSIESYLIYFSKSWGSLLEYCLLLEYIFKAFYSSVTMLLSFSVSDGSVSIAASETHWAPRICPLSSAGVTVSYCTNELQDFAGNGIAWSYHHNIVSYCSLSKKQTSMVLTVSFMIISPRQRWTVLCLALTLLN